MPHTNPWYLITADEIARIEGNLQKIRQYLPEKEQSPISGALGLLHTVQERRP